MATVNKPKKLRNTGILFELLTRQVTTEILAGKTAKASKLISKYFHNTELGKEYLLYNTLEKKKQLNESVAINLFDTIEHLYKKLDLKKLETEKYNLIKEIKEIYPVDVFFNSRIPQYRLFGSIQQWLSAIQTTKFVHPDSIQKPRQAIFEHITAVTNEEDENFDDYLKLNKTDRYMVYKLMLEKFNDKYKDLPDSQRHILSEYLLSISNNDKLTKFIESKQTEAKKLITEKIDTISDLTVKNRLNEVLDTIQPFKKGYIVRDTDVVNLMQKFELIDELNKIAK